MNLILFPCPGQPRGIESAQASEPGRLPGGGSVGSRKVEGDGEHPRSPVKHFRGLICLHAERRGHEQRWGASENTVL